MPKKNKIVFVGSHLSAKRGTKGISEKIAGLLGREYEIMLVSHYENLVLRLFDIVWTLLIKRFDIIHIDVFSNRGFIYADIASKIAKMKNEMLIMTLHGGMLTEKYERKPDHVRTVLQRAGVLQSPSLFLIEFFKKQGIEVAYMPNFINMTNFPYGRNKVQPYSLLWVRAFSQEYHPELAVETLHKLLENYPDATLTMIGPDKGSLNKIKQLVKKLGIENKVIFEGRVPNEKLYEYFQSYAVYLNTTAYESFGVAVLEAAACGIPIVSTRVGEIPYLWKEGDEILMSSENAIVMSAEVAKIFDSPELAEKLSKNARKKAEGFDWTGSVKKQWLDLLSGEDRNVTV